MRKFLFKIVVLVFILISCTSRLAVMTVATPQPNNLVPSWPTALPVYDHIVIVLEENKSYDQIIGDTASKNASYINNTLKVEGANLTQMYAEEHHSEGNYFWLLSGSNQGVGYKDRIPKQPITANNLAEQLINHSRSFKGYSEDLPTIGFTGKSNAKYARKHVPWISFSNIPNGSTVSDSSNLRFADFPTDYKLLPTISFVIPNLNNDMHDGTIKDGSIWLKKNLDKYYQWAKKNNSLLIFTFDEDNHGGILGGSTDPTKKENHIATILAGAHIKAGDYDEGKGVNHVSILRTLEAMYKLNKSGSQQENALKAGITDDFIITDIFDVNP